MNFKVLLISLLFVLAGCSSNAMTTETVTDKNTTPDVVTIENVESGMNIHHHMYDNMDRGNHDYFDKHLVIDPNVKVSDISRGDVVFFSNKDGEKDISRVVALPGEKVSIDKGQIYINGKKLDTFYGKALRAGLEQESYIEKMDKQGNDYDKKGMTELFELSTKEIKLSDYEFYLIGDDWLRGNMTVLNEDNVLGKVMGYNK